MPVNMNEVISACSILARHENLNKCLQESAKGAALAGGGALLGGVLGGPVGIVIGSVVGGLVDSSVCNEFRPVWKLIHEMSDVEKIRLYNHMQKVLNELDITDAAILMAIVGDLTAIGREHIIQELGNFFGKVQAIKPT